MPTITASRRRPTSAPPQSESTPFPAGTRFFLNTSYLFNGPYRPNSGRNRSPFVAMLPGREHHLAVCPLYDYPAAAAYRNNRESPVHVEAPSGQLTVVPPYAHIYATAAAFLSDYEAGHYERNYVAMPAALAMTLLRKARNELTRDPSKGICVYRWKLWKDFLAQRRSATVAVKRVATQKIGAPKGKLP